MTQSSLDPIFVTAKKRAAPVPDDVVTKQVEAALTDDPYLAISFLHVTTKNGVVELEGWVPEDWDTRMAMRIVKKIPGVKRVVNGLDIALDGTWRAAKAG